MGKRKQKTRVYLQDLIPYLIPERPYTLPYTLPYTYTSKNRRHGYTLKSTISELLVYEDLGMMLTCDMRL
jgi:hypothetical protein